MNPGKTSTNISMIEESDEPENALRLGAALLASVVKLNPVGTGDCGDGTGRWAMV